MVDQIQDQYVCLLLFRIWGVKENYKWNTWDYSKTKKISLILAQDPSFMKIYSDKGKECFNYVLIILISTGHYILIERKVCCIIENEYLLLCIQLWDPFDLCFGLWYKMNSHYIFYEAIESTNQPTRQVLKLLEVSVDKQ